MDDMRPVFEVLQRIDRKLGKIIRILNSSSLGD